MIGDPAWFQLPGRVRRHPCKRGYGSADYVPLYLLSQVLQLRPI
jgi:hypothetical protein